MIVNPNEKKETNYFYNNIMLIVSIFCVICFATYFNVSSQSVASKSYSLDEGSIYGPIVVKKGQTKICCIEPKMWAQNRSLYFSGEVLDEDKDTLYEFGKELWHEDGYDSEGYWVESDNKMQAYLTFSEEGKYYIQFHTEENAMSSVGLKITVKKGSGIPYFMVGFWLLIIVYCFFILLNKAWVSEMMYKLNDALEEMSDD